MTVKLYDIGMDYVHTDAVAKELPMTKKISRKSRSKNPTGQPVMAKKTGRRFRKGLSMKIKADGSVHVRHMSELGAGLAIMPPVLIEVDGLGD